MRLRGSAAVIALAAEFLCGATPTWASEGNSAWSATLYGGPASYSRVSDIFNGSGRLNGGMIGLAVNANLFDFGWDIHAAAETQITEYLFDSSYTTGALGLGLRFMHFPWKTTSMAIYSGPSYALNQPAFIKHKYGPSFEMKRFLNYIGLEFAVAVPHHERHWDAVLRVYHRSGMWGVYSDNVDEGSVIGVGLRARF